MLSTDTKPVRLQKQSDKKQQLPHFSSARFFLIPIYVSVFIYLCKNEDKYKYKFFIVVENVHVCACVYLNKQQRNRPSFLSKNKRIT